jgi:hypothetical protein
MKSPRNNKFNSTDNEGVSLFEEVKYTAYLDENLNHRDRILDYMKDKEFPESCYGISKNTGIDNRICSNICNKLYKEFIMEKPFWGSYLLKPEYREQNMSENPLTGWNFTFEGGLPRVQNLCFEAVAGVGCGIPDYRFGDDVCRVVLRFGVKRGRVTGFVRVPLGLDLTGLALVRDRIDSVCRDYGFVGLDWVWTSYELFTDLYGVFLSGEDACIRWRDAVGNLKKVYSKPYGTRVEARSVEHKLWSDGVELLYGSPLDLNIRREFDRLAEAVEENNKILGYYVSDVKQFAGLSRSLCKGQGEIRGELFDIRKRLEELDVDSE